MSALATLEAGLFLGLSALLAGLWAILYTLAQLRASQLLGAAAAAAYGLHAAIASIIILATPLGLGWKGLVGGSSLAALAIPPIACRFLCHTHNAGGSENDRKPAQHPHRLMARL